MELIDIMLKRRSIRKYTNEDIPEDKLNKILQAGLLAPSSRNRKPCELVVVKDKQTLKELSKTKASGSAMLADCNTAIAVFANTKKADTWIEDASIVLTYMDLMASSLDIGSCWTQMHLRYDENNESSEIVAKQILNMPDNYRIVGILSLGIPAQSLEAHNPDDLDKNKIKYI